MNKNKVLEFCKNNGVNLNNFRFRESRKKDCCFVYYKPLVKTKNGYSKSCLYWIFFYSYLGDWNLILTYMKQKDSAFQNEGVK